MTIEPTALTFRQVREANVARASVWHGKAARQWTVTDWATATAGELGEACNEIKKLRRIEDGIVNVNGAKTREEAIPLIAKELADTFIYLDLLANHLGIDLAEAVRDCFNSISVRENLPHRI